MESFSDDSDGIEVVSVERTTTPAAKTQMEFLLRELGLSDISNPITVEKLKQAMEKYDVEATDTQIADMVEFANRAGLQYIIDSSTSKQ